MVKRRTTELLLIVANIAIGGRCLAQQSPTAVSVAQPILTETADVEFSGMLEPAQQAEVRAAVDGTVRQVVVKDGDVVTEGQLLVQLDDRPLQSKIESANTELGKLKADLDRLKAKADKALKKVGDAKADEEVAAPIIVARDLVAANIQVQEVELEQLRSDLEATQITAPLAGRISQLSLKQGDAVHSSSASATLVGKITQTDPVRACFNVDQTTLNELRELQRGSAGSSEQPSQATSAGKPLAGKFSMAVGSEQDFKFSGRLDYLGSRADTQTGLVRGCAIFPNAKGALDATALASDEKDRAVRIRFGLQLPRKALLVADLAVGRDRAGRSFVLAVNDKHRIDFCPVELGARHRGMQMIESGIAADQWIVIGTPAAKLNPADAAYSPIDFGSDLRFANLQPGMTVNPVKVPMPRPGRTLRDKTHEEVEQQKAK